MAVKTLTITEDAYRRLRAHKSEGESFSEVILRLTGRPPISSFAGSLSGSSAARLRRAIERDRKARDRLDRGHASRDELLS